MEPQQEINKAQRREVVELLVAKKVMATPQRLDVGEILFSRRQHISAEQVLDCLHANGKAVSKATVYNTLNLFVERGLLRTLHLDPTRVVYDTSCEPHHHMLNVKTGELTDVPFDALEINGLPMLPPDTVVDAVEVIIKISPSG